MLSADYSAQEPAAHAYLHQQTLGENAVATLDSWTRAMAFQALKQVWENHTVPGALSPSRTVPEIYQAVRAIIEGRKVISGRLVWVECSILQVHSHEGP